MPHRRSLVTLGVLLLVSACSPHSHRAIRDSSKPLLGGFTASVQASPEKVWEATHRALSPYDIEVTALSRGHSCTDMDVLDAQVIVDIDPATAGTELKIIARAAWTVPQELLEAVFAELGREGIQYDPIGYPAIRPLRGPHPVLVELQRRASGDR